MGGMVAGWACWGAIAVANALAVFCIWIQQPCSACCCSISFSRRKAVSYVRFCSAAELVSASTDSTLRLWVRLR